MANIIDIGFDVEGNMLVANGDIVYGEATDLTVQDILLSKIGDNKQHPATGVDINSYINEDTPADLLPKIKQELINDGAEVVSLDITPEGLLQYEINYPE